jgi:hypothetical protein
MSYTEPSPADHALTRYNDARTYQKRWRVLMRNSLMLGSALLMAFVAECIVGVEWWFMTLTAALVALTAAEAVYAKVWSDRSADMVEDRRADLPRYGVNPRMYE